MILSHIVFDQNDEPVAVFYEKSEAIRCIQLATERKVPEANAWYILDVPLCNNADRFFEAWINQ
jgi:hypothetical protein